MLSTLSKNKGFKFDFFAEEWYHECRACGTELYAPTKKHMEGNFWLHTHSDDCLGGW
jgi:hypothetical protein